jgi:diguanylate cyclase (GGDEF)-like protein
MSDTATPQPSPEPRDTPEPAPAAGSTGTPVTGNAAGAGADPAASAVGAGQSGASASAAAPAPPARRAGAGRGLWPGTWALAAIIVLVAGCVASVIGARSVAHSNAAKQRAAFHASAAAIASTLKLSIQHEEDLVANASTFFAANPKASQSEFAAWSSFVNSLHRYPELERLGLVTVVRTAELPAFATRVTGKTLVVTPTTSPTIAHAPSSSSSSSTQAATSAAATAAAVGLLRISPPGSRPVYCLATAEIVRGPAKRARAGVDYCARSRALIASRASGKARYAPASPTRTGMLGVETPVYHDGGTAPSTGAGRMSSFVGWLREVLVPEVVLQQALRGHPGTAVTLRYHRGTSDVAFALGTPQHGAPAQTTNLHNGWTVASFGAPIADSVFSDPEARGLLIAGCLLSVLLALLIYALGSSRPLAAGAGPRPRTPRRPGQQEGLYDALTGLPNRALTLDRAERTVARAGRQSGMLAGALLVDVDWFKDVNDKLGRAAGDQLLRIVAERLEHVVRAEDSVGRLDGDQFLITVEAVARGARLDSLARRITEALHKPVELDDFGPSFHLTASIGIAFGRYSSHESMLHDAELALQASKAAGKDRYTLFNANMRAVIEDRGVLEAELNAALQDGQFFLLYQPICDLRTRKVVGLEALIRWRHPKQGVLLPADFIPLAEETGLIVPIGRWALQEACARAAAWEVAGHRISVGVQVSPIQLNRDGFATDVRRALQQSGVDPSLVTLELAEATVMSDADGATVRLNEIKSLGARIAIDDFGSGYAYRSDLQKMPLDFLKVDRSSLAASEDEDYRHWLLDAILVFARDLSLTVVAKGIESGEQVNALLEMGCTLAQGHFFGEPIPADALERLFEGGVGTVRATSTGLLD